MEKFKEVVSDSPFYCTHLGERPSDAEDVKNFCIQKEEGQGLLRYLQEDAFKDEETGLSRTYIVRDRHTDEVVGYFSLKASIITVNERAGASGKREFDTAPAVELSNFAINHSYKQKYPDVVHPGEQIFLDFILPIVREAAKHIGVYLLCIFALPYSGLINYYSGLGFNRLPPKQEAELNNRIKPVYDETCIFMYQRLVQQN